MQIDLMSFVYGALVGAVPTAIVMSIANLWDELRHKEKDDD